MCRSAQSREYSRKNDRADAQEIDRAGADFGLESVVRVVPLA